MLKGVDNFNFYDIGEHPFIRANPRAKKYSDLINEAIYGSDEFRMYAYKIQRCPKVHPHDWTDCPYAHRSEKARRRDPCKVPYCSIACLAFKKGKCPKGDSCQLAHGVFEYWLHPARYRTRVCNAGLLCQRKVCFFAHTTEELRPEPGPPRYHFVYPGRMSGGDDQYHHHQPQYVLQYSEDDSYRGVIGSSSTGGSSSGHEESVNVTSGMVPPLWGELGEYRYEEVEQVLKSLRGLEISDNGGSGGHVGVVDQQVKKTGGVIGGARRVGGGPDGGGGGGEGFEVSDSDSDLPHIAWISELVQ